MIRIVLLSFLLLAITRAETLSLAGEWRFSFDEKDIDLEAGPNTWSFPDTIRLPGTTAGEGKGPEENFVPKMDSETMRQLRERHPYIGPAWYQRDIEIPPGWQGKEIRLTLERVLWESRVWIDGKPVDTPRDSLSVPHRYDLTNTLVPGKTHTITLRIDNRQLLDIGTAGHAYTNLTQTIWNGVIGDLQLETFSKAHTNTAHITTGSDGSLKVVAKGSFQNGQKLAASIRPAGSESTPALLASVRVSNGKATISTKLAGAKPWSELTPNLYDLTLTLLDPRGNTLDTYTRRIGFREFTTSGRNLLINGEKTFLRGNLECAIFPQTGHPDAEGPHWEKIMRTSRDYGLNHIRFHSWCPPDAAFEAADKHGIYLQVELPNWTSNMGQKPPVDAFFLAEGERIIREYGHHPSFVMMALGNELKGDLPSMDALVEKLRTFAPEVLFTSTSFAFSPRGKLPGPADDFFISQRTRSGWVRGQGFLNSVFPSTDTDYAKGLSSIKIPLVTHEVGQYVVYPDLSTLPKYEKTPLRSTAMEIIRQDLEEKDMLDDAARFTRDSGKLAAILYKEDIERALRTKDLSGIQLLQLQDFPGQSTATVGLLDAFWDSKGLISPAEFREFSSPVVPLTRLPKFVWENNETFSADFELANFGSAPLSAAAFSVSLSNLEGAEIATRTFPPANYPLGNGLAIGKFETSLRTITVPTRLTLRISQKDSAVTNSWPVWVYPATAPEAPAASFVTHRGVTPECLADLDDGKSVLLLPSPGVIRKPVEARFIPVFWSPLHFSNQPGTLGTTINTANPLWENFPTESHTNWQWWELTANSLAFDTTGLDKSVSTPLRFIDKYNRNLIPTSILEAKVGPGKLLVCSLDVESEPERRIVARQLLRALETRVAAPDFNPQGTLSKAQLAKLFYAKPLVTTASSEDRNHPVSAAIDGNPSTFWHSEWRTPQPGDPHITLDLQQPQLLSGFRFTARPDRSDGRIAKYRTEISLDSEKWVPYGSDGELPDSKETVEISFPKPVKTRYLRIIAASDHAGGTNASAAEIVPVFGNSDDIKDLGIIPGFND